MKCNGRPYLVDGCIRPKESKIFFNLQALNSHECAGALTFDKYGNLNKFNIFLGGDSTHTWGHHHIINFHTHPTKIFVKYYSPPSYLDYTNKLLAFAKIYKNLSFIGCSLVFDKMGCWIFRPTKKLLKEFLKQKRERGGGREKILKILRFNTRILNIQFSQPTYIIKCNKGKFPKINMKKYIYQMKHIMTPGHKSYLGYEITFYPKNKKIIIKDIHQCIEDTKSKTRIYNIPPNVERKFLHNKYKD